MFQEEDNLVLIYLIHKVNNQKIIILSIVFCFVFLIIIRQLIKKVRHENNKVLWH